MKHVAELRQMIPRGQSNDRTPTELVTGNTPDISHLINFGYYSWIKYWEPTGFPADGEKLGKWLGVAHDIGQAMTYYVLKQNGKIVARSTVRPLSNEEMNDIQEKKDQEQFISLIDEILSPFNDHLISSPHVFTKDKDGCNKIENMVEPLTTNEMETTDRQNKEV